EEIDDLNPKTMAKLNKQFPKENGNVFSKDELFVSYKKLAGSNGLKPIQKHILDSFLMKPVRTQSGVAPITILTKPFPCPGKCIFCPSD
ncbi:hypothetical protein, partial [Klebsiella pneumoniae]|uniref:hypothetical protein n=1 Tax=Klebsiella pneumoniae TaxID=573 RepID=UPI00338F17FC